MKAIDNLLSALVSLLFREAKTNAEVGYNPRMGRIELTRSWYNGMRYVSKTVGIIGLFSVPTDVRRARYEDLRLVAEWAYKKRLKQDYSDGCPRIFIEKLIHEFETRDRTLRMFL